MKLLHTLSFRNKLKYSFLSITIIAVLVTGGLSYYIAAGILERNSLNLTQDSIVKSTQVVDEKLSKLMLVMMTFMISEPFKELLEGVSTGDTEHYYQHLTNMDGVFSQARVAEQLIHSIFISTPMGDFYPTSINRNHQVAFKETELYHSIIEAKRNIWVESHEDQLFTGKQNVVSLVLEPITDSAVFTVRDVYVVVNIRESGLRRLIGTNTADGSVRFMINTKEELIVHENNPLVEMVLGTNIINEILNSEQNLQKTYTIKDEEYYINYASLEVNDWIIVSIQSKDNVLRDLNYVKWMILIVAISCFIVVTLVSSGLIRYLLKPIKSLLMVMKKVEHNDLTARFEVKNEDELGQIGIRFNSMLGQIIALIDEVKQAEMNKRTTEMKALSAQMDPHFLYNTLNTVYWKLKLKKTEQSQQMILSLSQLFQLGLNKGQELTTIENEIRHVKEYLDLQKFCYEQLFEYEIKSEAILNGVQVPRIMLQPLVENSILHGFKDIEEGGFIQLKLDKWLL